MLGENTTLFSVKFEILITFDKNDINMKFSQIVYNNNKVIVNVKKIIDVIFP